MKRLFLWMALTVVSTIAAYPQKSVSTGEISGRVVTEDGSGIPNVMVMLSAVGLDQRSTTGARFNRITTDDEGNFKFIGLPPRAYAIAVGSIKALVRQPIPASELENRGYYRIGDNVTITMIRGGAITGRITNAAGEPVIGVQVIATRVRDLDGMKQRQTNVGTSRQTDDRGVYRIYGLLPGIYIISTRAVGFVGLLSPHDGDVPTYYPSSTRETAGEVTLTGGGEVGNIDIQYRGERGYTVSGTISGGGAPSQPFLTASVSLISLGASIGVSSSPGSNWNDGSQGFAIYGVTDGEYEIVARRGGFNDEVGVASTPRRVTVRGSDVGGIELKLAPLASVTGKVVLDVLPNVCDTKRKAAIEEIVIGVRRDTRQAATPNLSTGFRASAAPNEKGEFIIRYLDEGRYFIEPRLLTDDWYLKSMSMTSSATVATAGRGTRISAKPATSIDIARNGVSLKSGEKLSAVTIQIAGGAAGLSGKIVAATENASLPPRMRIHLIPAETTAGDDMLRYAEVMTYGNGSFAFRNLSPGRYLLVARIVPDSEPMDRPPTPVAWDDIERARLRKDAEARRIEVELQLCQRVKDYLMRFNP